MWHFHMRLAQVPPFIWRDIAQECLRQMKWARREVVDRHYGSAPDDRALIDEMTPLTLAPEGWTP